jgi:hypothetical protein
MNLRFATNSIRVRITAEELEQLRAGKPMGLEVPLPRGHVFRAKINLVSDAEWHFDSDPTGLWLSLPRSEIDTLANELPSKEGMSHTFSTHHGDLEVSFEVDLKSG